MTLRNTQLFGTFDIFRSFRALQTLKEQKEHLFHEWLHDRPVSKQYSEIIRHLLVQVHGEQNITP